MAISRQWHLFYMLDETRVRYGHKFLAIIIYCSKYNFVLSHHAHQIQKRIETAHSEYNTVQKASFHHVFRRACSS